MMAERVTHFSYVQQTLERVKSISSQDTTLTSSYQTYETRKLPCAAKTRGKSPTRAFSGRGFLPPRLFREQPMAGTSTVKYFYLLRSGHDPKRPEPFIVTRQFIALWCPNTDVCVRVGSAYLHLVISHAHHPLPCYSARSYSPGYLAQGE